MNFRERLEQARVDRNNDETVVANDNNEEVIQSEYFGISNARNLPACLDLRFIDGTRKAVPYSYILEVDYDPSGEMKITCTEKEIIIKGRDLEKLYDYLVGYRVKFVAERGGNIRNTKCGCCIDKIKVGI